jgi:hypothetical protein
MKLHPGQSRVVRQLLFTDTRFSTDCCSRGWGKTYAGASAVRIAIQQLMELPAWVPNKRVYVIGPTFDQAVDIYWPVLFDELQLSRIAKSSSESDGRALFPNNTKLRLISYESVERMRGKGAFFVLWDEVSSCKKGMKPKQAWEKIIRPCINTRWSVMKTSAIKERILNDKRSTDRHVEAALKLTSGKGMMISTPEGFNFFYDLCQMHTVSNEWVFNKFDYTTSPELDPAEIEALKSEMDPVSWSSEYGADFKESGKSVFYCFDRAKHVLDEDVERFSDEDVHCAIDFNVDIQATSMYVIRDDVILGIDECFGHPDTETLGIAILNRFIPNLDTSSPEAIKRRVNGLPFKVYAYPDPTGKSRKTSTPVGRTDLSILQSMGFTVLAHKKSPPIVDSANAVNRKLLTASGETSLYFSPRQVKTIRSMERTVWADKDGAIIDKTEGEEHFSDGVRYFCEYKYPILLGRAGSHKSKNY